MNQTLLHGILNTFINKRDNRKIFTYNLNKIKQELERMSVRLVPLRNDELPEFIERAIYEGTQTLMRSKEHEEFSAALAAARHNVGTCFQPAYINKQLVYHIYVPELKTHVGQIWLEQPYHTGQDSTFVAYIFIDEAHRRKGYAKAALLEAEAVTRSLGLKKIELYVFAFNTAAKDLYEKLGYYAKEAKMWGKAAVATRFVMTKHLDQTHDSATPRTSPEQNH